MDGLETILTRRSVRRFTDQMVEDDKIKIILQAAMSAPSAGNSQPWHFIVVKEREILDEFPNIHPYAGMCKEAQVAIIPCADPRLEKHDGFWVEDMSAAVQNILLSVHTLGLGGVWVGVYPSESKVKNVRNLLGVPDEIIPFCIVPIGYSDMQQNAIDRFQEDRVHINKW